MPCLEVLEPGSYILIVVFTIARPHEVTEAKLRVEDPTLELNGYSVLSPLKSLNKEEGIKSLANTFKIIARQTIAQDNQDDESCSSDCVVRLQ